MSDLVVNNAVLIVFGAFSLWWQIGGRDRRALGAIRERVELLALVDEHTDFGRRLRRELDARTKAYAARPVGVWPVYVGLLLVVAGGVIGGVLKYQHADADVTWGNAISTGAGLGAAASSVLIFIVTLMDYRRDRRERRNRRER